MVKLLSRTQEINQKLKEQGKVTYLDSPEDIAAIDELNKQMEDVRREFQVKNYNSQNMASGVRVI